MTRVDGALFALCSALALGTTARLSAAAEPAQASSARTVELTAVGTPSQQHWLEDLVGPHSAPGATLTITESDHFDPSDVLRVAPDSSAILRCWVDLRETTRARIYFSAHAGQRFLLRDLELSGSFDELDRESLSQVLASSWSALFEDEQLGLSREETQTLLEKRSATDVRSAPTSQTPTPTPREKPLPKPVASATNTAESVGGAEAPLGSLRLEAFYAANAFSKALWLTQGPGLALSVGVQD